MVQIFGMQLNWLALALVGMLFASATNLTLKLIVKNYDVTNYDFKTLLPLVAIVFILTAAIYLIFLRHITVPGGLTQLVVLFVIFAALGFAAVVYAMQEGKVALVTAVLSLSTIVVALAAYFLLGEQFALKEIAALAFAVLAILLLVF